jgi:P27 family predicted phage terminase small subunit
MATVPKSEELHALTGTKSEVVSERPSALPGGRPRVPEELSPEASREFKKLCATLRKRRALTPGDAAILRLWAILFDRHRKALSELETDGLVCEYERLDSNGQPRITVKINIYLRIAETCETKMIAILDRLGLTPAHRDRVRPTRTAKPKVLDPGEEFMRRAALNNSNSATAPEPAPAPEVDDIEEEQPE